MVNHSWPFSHLGHVGASSFSVSPGGSMKINEACLFGESGDSFLELGESPKSLFGQVVFGPTIQFQQHPTLDSLPDPPRCPIAWF